MRVSFIFAILIMFGAQAPAMAGEGDRVCPDAEAGRALFNSGELKEWPNYTEVAGSRVQRQHPETAFIAAQAKYMEANGRTGVSCQYSNYVGLVAQTIILDVAKITESPTCTDESNCQGKPYWRADFVESHPSQDQPGRELMLVCTENRGGVAYPSSGCNFKTVK